jgi:hypothetical protein
MGQPCLELRRRLSVVCVGISSSPGSNSSLVSKFTILNYSTSLKSLNHLYFTFKCFTMVSNGNGTQNSIRAPNPPVEESIFKSFHLDGRTVIISSGSGGIGYEVARGLAEAGANMSSPSHLQNTI